jgi:hypothetical protein
MTYYPPGRRRPRPCDFHDVSPPVFDWVANEYTAPHTDCRDPRIIAANIAKQFRDKARAAKKSPAKNAPPAANRRVCHALTACLGEGVVAPSSLPRAEARRHQD